MLLRIGELVQSVQGAVLVTLSRVTSIQPERRQQVLGCWMLDQSAEGLGVVRN